MCFPQGLIQMVSVQGAAPTQLWGQSMIICRVFVLEKSVFVPCLFGSTVCTQHQHYLSFELVLLLSGVKRWETKNATIYPSIYGCCGGLVTGCGFLDHLEQWLCWWFHSWLQWCQVSFRPPQTKVTRKYRDVVVVLNTEDSTLLRHCNDPSTRHPAPAVSRDDKIQTI